MICLLWGDEMALSEARKRANQNYINKQDEIKIRVPKGVKGMIQSVADGHGKSVNSYIVEAIQEKMERDGDK